MADEIGSTSQLPERVSYAHLDVLRGLMAIIVLFSHTSQILIWRLVGSEGAVAIAAKTSGRLAVIVFFLLSGYLITRSIQANIARHGQFVVMDYVTSRLARIYPPFLGALLLSALVWAIIHGLGLVGATSYGLSGDLYRVRDSFSITASDLLSAAAMQAGFVGANGALWTLYLEVHLYTAVLALSAWRVQAIGPRILCILAGAAGFYAMRFAVSLAGVWFLGALFAVWSPRPGTRLVIAVAAGLVTLATFAAQPQLFGLGMDTPVGRWVELPPALAIGALILTAASRWRYPHWLTATGGYSYSLYVVHWPLLMLALSLTQNWTGHSLWRGLAVCAASIPAIIPVAMAFASVTERQRIFTAKLRNLLSRPAANRWRRPAVTDAEAAPPRLSAAN